MLQTALTIDNPNLQPANDFVIDHEPGVLARIYEKDIQMSVFRRTLNIEVQQYANFLQREQIGFQLTQCVSLHQVESLLAIALPRHGARHHFIQDVSNIVDMFACLFGLETIGLRLHVLNKTMCPRFHVDQVPCRLITTYAGQGTEWLARNDDLSPRTDNIHRLLAGEIALLKGKAWMANQDRGAIHRSPALRPQESRVLLTLDWAEPST